MTSRQKRFTRRAVICAASAASVMAGLRRGASAKHEPLHERRIIGTIAGALQANVELQTVPEFKEIEYLQTGSDQETVERIRASEGAYDLSYVSSEGLRLLRDGKLIRAVSPQNLTGWDKVLGGLKSAPAVVNPDGNVETLPLDWGFYGVVQKTADKYRIVPNENLFAADHRVCLWGDDTGILVCAHALGIQDPFQMTQDQFSSFASTFTGLRSQVVASWYEAGSLATLWSQNDVDIAVVPNWVLADLSPDQSGEVDPTAFSRGALTWVSGLNVVAASTIDDAATSSLYSILLDPKVGRALMRDWRAGHANKETYELVNTEEPKLIREAGLPPPGALFKNPIWEKPISEDVKKQIQAFRSAFKL